MSGTDVQREEGFFDGTGGVRLFEQKWLPSFKPIGSVIIIHGLVDHSSYYSETASELVKRGYGVYAFDLRGHGRSGGEKSFVESFDDYLSDLEIFRKRVKEAHRDQPIFLLAHSMGGAIATMFVLTAKPKIQGLLLSGAALKVGKEVSRLTKALTPALSRLAPRMRALNLEINFVSRNRDIVERKKADPLIDHKKIPTRTGAELLKTINKIQANMENLTIPVVIMHGTADKWTNLDGSKELYSRSKSQDKTLKLYEGFYHEILSDPERARVHSDVLQWLGTRSN